MAQQPKVAKKEFFNVILKSNQIYRFNSKEFYTFNFPRLISLLYDGIKSLKNENSCLRFIIALGNTQHLF